MDRDREMQLILLVRHHNDQRAFEELYHYLYPKVMRLAQRYPIDGYDYEDLFQISMIGIYRVIKSYERIHCYPLVKLAVQVAKGDIGEVWKQVVKRRKANVCSLDEVLYSDHKNVRLVDTLVGTDSNVLNLVVAREEIDSFHRQTSVFQAEAEQQRIRLLARRVKRPHKPKKAKKPKKEVRHEIRFPVCVGPKQVRPVQRIDNGMIFDGPEEAAKSVAPNYGKGNVLRAIRENGFFDGTQWRWADA